MSDLPVFRLFWITLFVGKKAWCRWLVHVTRVVLVDVDDLKKNEGWRGEIGSIVRAELDFTATC